MKTLKDLTMEENKEEAYPFVVINNLFANFESDKYGENVADMAKCLILDEQVRIWKKYDFPIDATALEKYLGSEHNSTSSYEISMFLFEGKKNSDPDVQRQYLLTADIAAFGYQIMTNLERILDEKENLERRVVSEIATKYGLDPKDRPLYEALKKRLIETNLGNAKEVATNPELKLDYHENK